MFGLPRAAVANRRDCKDTGGLRLGGLATRPRQGDQMGVSTVLFALPLWAVANRPDWIDTSGPTLKPAPHTGARWGQCIPDGSLDEFCANFS